MSLLNDFSRSEKLKSIVLCSIVNSSHSTRSMSRHKVKWSLFHSKWSLRSLSHSLSAASLFIQIHVLFYSTALFKFIEMFSCSFFFDSLLLSHTNFLDDCMHVSFAFFSWFYTSLFSGFWMFIHLIVTPVQMDGVFLWHLISFNEFIESHTISLWIHNHEQVPPWNEYSQNFLFLFFFFACFFHFSVFIYIFLHQLLLSFLLGIH